MFWKLILFAICAFIYVLTLPFKYWKKRGVKQGNPVLIFGDSWGQIFRLQDQAQTVQMLYNIGKNERYCGIYQFLTPSLVLRDPDLIKQLTVKHFDHFVDHRAIISEEVDPLLANNLFALTGQRWREMRATMSPVFTSSKMKHMFSLISQSGEQFVDFFLKQHKDVITLEMKDTFTRFTNDVIANTAFGIQCDSLKEPKNDFYLMGKETTDFSSFSKTVALFGYLLAPSLSKFLGLRLFSKKVDTFFNKLVKENIESREKHHIVRPDMINLLLEAKKHGELKPEESGNHPDAGFATVEESAIGRNSKNRKIEITDQDITSQALVFFFAGFDSVSSLMCFISYELAVNPDIQRKLRQEVDNTMKTCNGELTYEVLVNMKYMDMVMSETLRKWPNAPAVDRVCTKDFTIEPIKSYEKPVCLKKNDILILPIYALHHDPQYFPDPERFDPERFSDENKAKIQPCTYIPFGSGPRNCIGSRFALLESKILFFYILANFEIIPIEKTQIPLKLAKGVFNMNAENGFWMAFKRRNKDN